MERRPALADPRPQPGGAVHALRGPEEEGREGRQDGERDTGYQSRSLPLSCTDIKVENLL